MLHFIIALTILFSAACATTSSHRGSRAPYPGSVLARPSLNVLPELDVRYTSLSEESQQAWTSAEALFDIDAPLLPERRDAASLNAWSASHFRVWMQQKLSMLDVARQDFDVAGAKSQRERIVAAAIVALMYEEVGRTIVSIPVPDELSSQPKARTNYRQAIYAEARPYLSYAQRAYDACAQNAEFFSPMTHWSGFCAGRAKRLHQRASKADSSTSAQHHHAMK